ncbi:unnamed protein product [Rotaria sp. Silwood2]|nr:unnamed protein product [Rotaria sp. Silwood2]CAF3482098.1 unnamed protein product [Rotaria sp. Silwood2]CAF4454143.1 unnamed protein product [Rotaria sp. Silwood2]CAF4565548.1 unnamed protein product [Rotaria sp. Silwood2]
MISTILLHISANNDGSKELAHALGWKYKQIRETNVDLVINDYLVDYPCEYTGMPVIERQKTKRLQAVMKRAPVSPEATPIVQGHPRSQRTEIENILVREPMLE